MTIGFNYNANQSQWLMLGPGLIDWVTAGAHLGLYRNYATLHVDDHVHLRQHVEHRDPRE